MDENLNGMFVHHIFGFAMLKYFMHYLVYVQFNKYIMPKISFSKQLQINLGC